MINEIYSLLNLPAFALFCSLEAKNKLISSRARPLRMEGIDGFFASSGISNCERVHARKKRKGERVEGGSGLGSPSSSSSSSDFLPLTRVGKMGLGAVCFMALCSPLLIYFVLIEDCSRNAI